MKMINDMDLYYADRYAKVSREPMWMKAERMDFCDMTVSDHRSRSFLRTLFRKEAK